ncbi:unnamed protein product [Dovyalis caffra]|uniref:ABC transporter domain-containing protein n=1 Tax=Dovyalis caffra TaxID=77055 RepID=A0AAV1QTE6_9ROSI|nr:unnamed protein product [Dovyalis caffra]
MADDNTTATFWTQADALLRKNLTYQIITEIASISDSKETSSDRCGYQFSDLDQLQSCPIPSPPKWPPFLQVPPPEYRAVRSSSSHLFQDLPDQSCRHKGNCPGSATEPSHDFYIDSAFIEKNSSLYNIQSQCGSNSTISVSVTNAYLQLFKGLGAEVKLEFIKEMPKPSDAPFKFDIASQLGTLFFTWLYPGFALYRGLYEFGEYAASGSVTDTDGMKWGNLFDSDNGMRNVMIIMLLEWLLVLFIAYYVDQVFSCGSGKHPKYLLQKLRKKHSRSSSFQKPSLHEPGSKVLVDMDKPDLLQEREKVEQLLSEPSTHGIICDNLRKVYPGRDGNPEKWAVKGLSLAIPQGECLGLLGPNGAGKTSFISMMIGLTTPTSGAAYVDGLDIQTQMDSVYTRIGVCPQHDLLWDALTGREHLLFYGRLKNLKGVALKRAVEESLKSLKLFDRGVADKYAGKYSGGMKRRLSVAISLIGDPKVVYMDEPSSGLDPASRSTLWNVVKRAKQDKAIVLTTHSMEEAEHLCDRVGIYVDGSLMCIGNPKELKARYGGTYVFTITASVNNENEVEDMVRDLSPNAERTYHLAGTHKFEMPKHEVSIAGVFHAVEVAKGRFPVYAWGLSDTTLEDVFIKVTNSAQQSHTP